MSTTNRAALDNIVSKLMRNSMAVKASTIVGKKAKSEAIDQLTALLRQAEREARINELTNFNLPQYDHTKCIDKSSCIGYENAQSDFDNEKEIRLVALQVGQGQESGEDLAYVCQYCGAEYGNSSSRYSHIRAKHADTAVKTTAKNSPYNTLRAVENVSEAAPGPTKGSK